MSFIPTTPALLPVIAYLENGHAEILHEDRSQPASVVLTLKLPSGAIRTLTTSYEFLQTYLPEQISAYLEKHDFLRRLNEQGNQHIAKKK
jgi:hypothetical protein